MERGMEMYDWVCPACNSHNKGDFPDNNVCGVCGWEQDTVQHDDPDYRGGANPESLNEHRAEWLKKQSETRQVASA